MEEKNIPYQEQKASSSSKAMLPIIGIVGTFFVLALVGGAWYSNQKMTSESKTTATPEAQQEQTYENQAIDDAAEAKISQTIEVEAGAFYYKPNEIRVKKGETVRIVLQSKDMMHDFNIDELGVKIPVVKAGSTSSVTFTADTVGEFEFYCSVGSHKAQGQVGTVIVE